MSIIQIHKTLLRNFKLYATKSYIFRCLHIDLQVNISCFVSGVYRCLVTSFVSASILKSHFLFEQRNMNNPDSQVFLRNIDHDGFIHRAVMAIR